MDVRRPTNVERPAADVLSRVILLVEDNIDDVELTRHAFARTGVSDQVVVAGDGLQALGLLLPSDARVPLRPAIVVADISMPRMGGLELLACLRAAPATAGLPVVMLTTSTHDPHLVSSNNLGASGYLSKPVTAEGFFQVARTLGVYWLDTPPPRPQ